MRTVDRLVADRDHARGIRSHGGPKRCTGIAATWCPIHGHCTCPRGEDGGHLIAYACSTSTYRDVSIVVHDRACPLHRPDSFHGDGG